MSFLDNIFKKKVRGSWENKSPLQSPASPPPSASSPQRQPYKEGDRIAGKYEIYHTLGGEGKSGMGIVYVCYDHESKDGFALKTFQDKYLQDKRIKDNFKKEALAWTQLERHPYIVQALWVQVLDYRLFVASQFIFPDEQGRNTLTDYLKCPITLKQALIWGIQFCHGMEYACSKGVSPHRDIKPDNIMITQDGTVKITDFGLAGLWEGVEEEELARGVAGEQGGLTFLRNERGKVVCGTKPYMAPEQFDGVADVRSDMYSFGIVLYQMLNNGKLPFYPRTDESWEKAHKTYPVPSFRAESLATPEVAAVIRRCLAKESVSRYRDFKEVRKELEGIYEQETEEKAPAPPGKNELDVSEHSNKGLSLDALGLLDEAIGEYREALKINPEHVEAHNNLGIALKDKGLLDEAIGEYREALRINPGDAGTHNNLGIALAIKGLLEEAIGEFKEALQIKPGLEEANMNLGHALYNKGLLDEAIREYRKALKINPGDADAHNNLGSALYDKGLLDEAIREYREALKINPEFAEAHSNLGHALYNKGLLDEAIREYRKALKINPGDAEDHNNLGSALYDKGLPDEAIGEYQEALKINPGYAEAHNNLGTAFKDKGLIDEAINAYENFIKYAPSEYEEQIIKVRELIRELKSKKEKQIIKKPLEYSPIGNPICPVCKLEGKKGAVCMYCKTPL